MTEDPAARAALLTALLREAHRLRGPEARIRFEYVVDVGARALSGRMALVVTLAGVIRYRADFSTTTLDPAHLEATLRTLRAARNGAAIEI